MIKKPMKVGSRVSNWGFSRLKRQRFSPRLMRRSPCSFGLCRWRDQSWLPCCQGATPEFGQQGTSMAGQCGATFVRCAMSVQDMSGKGYEQEDGLKEAGCSTRVWLDQCPGFRQRAPCDAPVWTTRPRRAPGFRLDSCQI